MSYCVICNTPCINDINICDSIECEFKSKYEFMFDNFVSEYIRNYKTEFKFIMLLAYNSASSIKQNTSFDISYLFTTLPEINVSIIDTVLQVSCKDYVENLIHSVMDNGNSDLEIIESFGLDLYRMIKFIIKNAVMEFKFVEFPIVNIDAYKFIYSDVANNTFDSQSKQYGMCYLFHGSSVNNWYSIISNGLKVFSKTDRMRNGASYGNGIYLSNSLALSTDYSLKNHSATNNVVVGVFEVIGEASDYKKKSNIFVIPDESKLRLKYLISFKKSNCTQQTMRDISSYFTNDKVTLVRNTNSYVSAIKNKRLLMEINRIMKHQAQKNDNEGEFKLWEIDNTNIWNVSLINIDMDTNLYKDMITKGVDNIHLEVRFENSFPLSPPFVRVIKPTFKRLTGHVTQGGSICAEILTNQGWSPATSMESLLITIKAIISEDGRLETTQTSRYGLSEAKASYANMLKVHGWN